MEPVYQAEIYMTWNPKSNSIEYRVMIGKHGQETPKLTGKFIGWENISDLFDGPNLAMWLTMETSRLQRERGVERLNYDANLGLIIDLAVRELVAESNSDRSQTD